MSIYGTSCIHNEEWQIATAGVHLRYQDVPVRVQSFIPSTTFHSLGSYCTKKDHIPEVVFTSVTLLMNKWWQALTKTERDGHNQDFVNCHG